MDCGIVTRDLESLGLGTITGSLTGISESLDYGSLTGVLETADLGGIAGVFCCSSDKHPCWRIVEDGVASQGACRQGGAYVTYRV